MSLTFVVLDVVTVFVFVVVAAVVIVVVVVVVVVVGLSELLSSDLIVPLSFVEVFELEVSEVEVGGF